MITLNRKLKKDSSGNAHLQPQNDTDNLKRVSIRDRLLVKEVQEMEQNLPNSCQVYFSDPNNLSEFSLIISPDEGFWRDGKFKFYVFVPEEYNMTPPIVKCKTKLWHPNISITGDICLSLLRQNSIDGSGWAPTRRLKDVVWGLNSLFTDLLNFDDPLNSEAAEDYLKDKTKFQVSVREYINMFARR